MSDPTLTIEKVDSNHFGSLHTPINDLLPQFEQMSIVTPPVKDQEQSKDKLTVSNFIERTTFIDIREENNESSSSYEETKGLEPKKSLNNLFSEEPFEPLIPENADYFDQDEPDLEAQNE